MEIIRSKELRDEFFEYKEIEEIGVVKKIIKEVAKYGDKAVRKYTKELDGVELEEFDVKESEVKKAYGKIGEFGISTIKAVADNISKFAQKQIEQFKEFEYEIEDGVVTGQKVIPIERVGIYVPGGRFPLASSLLMCAIPAKVAGVKEIVVCSPPSYNNSVHPLILVAADVVSVREIYKIGGAQAIGAMAYGTESIRMVDKIVGPGNKYVTYAKKDVYGRVGIDFIAGPTELMIIADKEANPLFIAFDILAQAEHDTEALPILITDSLELANAVKRDVARELKRLKTKGVALEALKKNGKIIMVKDIYEAIEIANKRAPEHLELQVSTPPELYIKLLYNYGSLFIGEYATEVLGDYSSGLNHVLPTNGSARYNGGLSVRDFLKLQTTLKVTQKGLIAIGPRAKHFSELEGLDGHAKSIDVRL